MFLGIYIFVAVKFDKIWAKPNSNREYVYGKAWTVQGLGKEGTSR